MWSEGVIGIPASISGKPVAVHYWIKHYDNPSKYGIDGGRISKLMLKIGDEIVANYDRGWDIRPMNEAAETALRILVHEIDWREKE
mgnify:CR=1 FL=1